MGTTWVLSAPGGSHVCPMNLAIWVVHVHRSVPVFKRHLSRVAGSCPAAGRPRVRCLLTRDRTGQSGCPGWLHTEVGHGQCHYSDVTSQAIRLFVQQRNIKLLINCPFWGESITVGFPSQRVRKRFHNVVMDGQWSLNIPSEKNNIESFVPILNI